MAPSSTTFSRSVDEAVAAEDPSVRRSFFASMGWITAPVTTGSVEAISLSAAGVPQLLVFEQVEPSSAVSLAYSHEAHFAVEWNSDALRVMPATSWRSDPGDSLALALDTGHGPRAAQVLSALHRSQFPAFRASAPRATVDPLVIQLARSFANLRLRAAEAYPDHGQVAENAAFQLFHQLLFIRFHEDRYGPMGGKARLADLDSRAAMAIDLLRDTVDRYSEHFNSELFTGEEVLSRLPPAAVLNVVREMSEPWNRLRLDFSVTSNDIAGRLYQSYLALAPTLTADGRLFPTATAVNRQRQSGAFYTPAGLARYVVRSVLSSWLIAVQPKSPSEVTVFDPACGSGIFLLEAYRELVRYFSELQGRALSADERVQILVSSLYGSDTDHSAVAMARVQLLEEGQLGARRLPPLAQNLHVADALSDGLLSDSWPTVADAGGFDVILSNPPFHSPKGAIAAGYDTIALSSRFDSASGTGWNLASVFVERGLQLLRSNGQLGMLLPQALLDGPSANALRSYVGVDRLGLVIDFGRAPLFEQHMVYVAAVGLFGGPIAADTEILFHRLMNTSALDSELDNLSFDREPSTAVSSFTVMVRRDDMELQSWSPFVHRWRELLAAIGAETTPFDRVPRSVIVGTQTGNDGRFVIGKERWESVDDTQIRIDGAFVLPTEFAPKWAPGKSVRPFRVDWTGQRVVLPQTGLLPELDDFISEMGGKPSSFFPGGLDVLRGRKVIVRCLFDEPASVGDIDGEWMIPQGGGGCHALRVSSALEASFLEALLNSALYQWLLAGLAQTKASGFSQLLLHHWQYVPRPHLSRPSVERIAKSGRAVRRALGRKRELRLDEYWRTRHELDIAVFEELEVAQELQQIVSLELIRRP